MGVMGWVVRSRDHPHDPLWTCVHVCHPHDPLWMCVHVCAPDKDTGTPAPPAQVHSGQTHCRRREAMARSILKVKAVMIAARAWAIT